MQAQAPQAQCEHGWQKYKDLCENPDKKLKKIITVVPWLSGPRLSGFLDYPDFFSGPNFVMNIY